MKKPLEIFQTMSDKGNNDLKLIPLCNIENVRTGSNGWGSISIAIPNECVPGFILGNFTGGLIFCHTDEFEKEKKL